MLCLFLQEGRGEAFYEIGVHDNGKLVGIGYEEQECSLLALFYMAKCIKAKLEVTLVRLGQSSEEALSLEDFDLSTWSVQLKVTKPTPDAIEPELDSFFRCIRTINNSQSSLKFARQRSMSAQGLPTITSTKKVVAA